nr:putative reverse transcriptase domain-containing protein [Tanacetum cinerariifolium]
MAPVTRRGPNTPPNNVNPNNMTPESVQAMIDQALLQNSTNEDESYTLAVSNVHGAGTRMHIPAHSGSEAHNELPDSILPNEPKPL